MKTNATKFLAVLAVLAMAFAGFAVIASSEQNDAASATTEETITATEKTLEAGKAYGVNPTNNAITLTVPATGDAITLYILGGTGKTVTLNNGGSATTSVAVNIYIASAVSGTTATYDDSYVVKFAANTTAGSYSSGAMTVTESKITSATVPTMTTTTPYKTSGTTVEFLKDGSTTYITNGQSVTVPVGALGTYTISTAKADSATTAVNTIVVGSKDATTAIAGGNITVAASDADAAMTVTNSAQVTSAAVSMTKGNATLGAGSYAFGADVGLNMWSTKDLIVTDTSAASSKISYTNTTAETITAAAYVYGNVDFKASAGSSLLINTVKATGSIEYTLTTVNKSWKAQFSTDHPLTASLNINSAGAGVIHQYTSGDLKLVSGTWVTSDALTTIDAASSTLTIGAGIVFTPKVNLTTINDNLVLEAGAEVTASGLTALGGNVTLKGNAELATKTGANAVTFSKDVSIADGATLKTGQGAFAGDMIIRGTLDLGGDSTVTDKSVALYGVIISSTTTTLTMTSNTQSVAEKMSFKTYTGSEITNVTIAVGGTAAAYITIDLSGATEIAYLSGIISESQTFGQTQKIIVDKNLEIKAGAVITINGSFTVNDDVTVIVTNGAILINGIAAIVDIDGLVDIEANGVFNVQKADKVTVCGDITNNGSMYIATVATTIEADGSIISDETGVTKFGGLTIKAGGFLGIYGSADLGSTINNSGSVTLNEAILTNYTAPAGSAAISTTSVTTAVVTPTINMLASGATVNIVSFTFSSTSDDIDGSYLTITDSPVKYKDVASTYNAKLNENTIRIGAGADLATDTVNNTGMAGIVITETFGTYKLGSTTYLTLNMNLSGMANVVSTSSSIEAKDIKGFINLVAAGTGFYSNMTFSDGFVIGDYVTVTNYADVTIDKTMYVNESGKFITATGGITTVTGVIAYYTNNNVTITNGLMFTLVAPTVTVRYAAGLENALEILEDYTADITLTLYGTGLYVYGDVTVPSNVRISSATATTLNIGSTALNDVTMTISAGAKIGSNVTLNVAGTVYAEVAASVAGTVIADVKTTTNGIDAKWTNLYSALSEAVAGEVIEVTGSAVTISKNLTVPEGVTLYIPSGTTATIPADKKVNIIVNGILACPGIEGTFGTDITKASVLTVNGVFMTSESTASTVAEKVDAVHTFYKSSGTYYFISDEDGDYVYISGLAFAVLTDADAFYIYGKVSEALPVLFASDVEKSQRTITLMENAQLNVMSMSIAFAKVDASNTGATITGTISGAVDTEDEGTVVLAKYHGIINDTYKASTSKYTFTINAINGGVTVLSGTVTTAGSITAEASSKFIVADEGTFVVPSGAVLTLGQAADIEGTITVAAGGKLAIDSEDVVVDGLIDVKYSTTSGAAQLDISAITLEYGTINVAEGAKLNITKTIKVGVEPTTLGAGTAAIIGDVSDLASDAAIIVFPGADVSEMTIEASDGVSTGVSTEFYINGELYMTVYASNPNTVTFATILELLDFKIEGYETDDLDDPETWGLKDGAYIGSVEEAYATVEASEVGIKTSWSNGLALYIDGVKMLKDTYSLTVGIHSVSATINAGYACDNMTITFNGIAVPITKEGAIITITVDDQDSILAVSGDVYIPEPEPVTPEEKSEWTITTILLVILVILIAIMAVIVALRLNRS